MKGIISLRFFNAQHVDDCPVRNDRAWWRWRPNPSSILLPSSVRSLSAALLPLLAAPTYSVNLGVLLVHFPGIDLRPLSLAVLQTAAKLLAVLRHPREPIWGNSPPKANSFRSAVILARPDRRIPHLMRAMKCAAAQT